MVRTFLFIYALTGALTYYFDANQRVGRLTFYGTTGDPRRLIHHVSHRFGLSRRLTNDPSLTVYESTETSGLAQSHLRLRPAPVVMAGENGSQYQVSLVVSRTENRAFF